MVKKHVVLVAVLALVMSVLAACGNGGGGSSGNANSATLNVWGMGTEGDNLKTLATSFMQQNPGIHINVQSIPWSNAHAKLLTAVGHLVV